VASTYSIGVAARVTNGLVEGGQDMERDVVFPWFAVRVRSNHEKVASLHLRQRGYEEFSPTYKAESRWSDRKKTVERSLFPGYVFSRLNPLDRLPVLTAPGVFGLVGFGKEPCPITEQEIENIRRMVQSGLLVTPCPFLQQGQLVLLEQGPLAGLEGIVQEIKGKLRVVVSVELLQRSVSAEIDRSWVRPLTHSRMQTRLTHGAWVETKGV